MLICNLVLACAIPQMKNETSYLRMLYCATIRWLSEDVFRKAWIMSTKEISHFVRNDGVSPSDGGRKSGGWSLSEVEVAATFPPIDDNQWLSFRPHGDLGDRRSQISYSTHAIRWLMDATYAIFKWLGLEITAECYQWGEISCTRIN